MADKKSTNERVKAHFQRKKDEGLKQIRVWVEPRFEALVRRTADNPDSIITAQDKEINKLRVSLADAESDLKSHQIDAVMERRMSDSVVRTIKSEKEKLKKELTRRDRRLEVVNERIDKLLEKNSVLRKKNAEAAKIMATEIVVKDAPKPEKVERVKKEKQGEAISLDDSRDPNHSVITASVHPKKIDTVMSFIKTQNMAQKIIDERS